MMLQSPMRYLASDMDAWMANVMAISGNKYRSLGSSLAKTAAPVRAQTRPGQTPLATNFAQFASFPPEIRQKVLLDLVEPVTIEGVVRTAPTTYGVSIHLRASRAAGRRSELASVRSFASIPLYAINSESRDLAIRVFGRPARDAFPFNPHTDTLRRTST